jgi:hypothetical protein
VVVVAKAPVAGRVKTRLCPPCAPWEAADVARAALADTLATVAAVDARRPLLVLDGAPGPWLPRGFDVVPQVGGGLDRRLAAAAAAAPGPLLLVGMDTPQVDAAALTASLDSLLRRGVDAVLGPATDGGWWALGLRRADARVFLGVPTSTARTGEHQLRRLHALGLQTASLPRYRDVDTFADAVAVARDVPDSRFAAAVRRVGRRLAARSA